MRFVVPVVFGLLAIRTAAADQLEEVVGRAAGTYEFKVIELSDGELRCRSHERGYLRAAFSGSKDFILFQPTEGDPEYDATIYIIDGQAILASFFSPKIHPYGAEGRILPLRKGEVIYESEFGIAPHCLPYASAYIDRSLKKLNGLGVTLEEDNGQYVIQLDARSIGKKYLERYYIDPSKEYLISRHEITVFPENRVVVRVEKDWARTGNGRWYVRSIRQAHLPRREGDQSDSRRFDFPSLDTNVDIPEELFTVDALGLPPGTRIIDTRVKPNQKIIVMPPKVDLALIEKIVGELPRAEPPRDLRLPH